ncbi:hypothetical protein [Herbaspirillum seropedicae]|uniref:hypothetical protein n=1 Tax=Herbaspirillum seropedicae TaxID=964 RepID=UPI0031D9D2B1
MTDQELVQLIQQHGIEVIHFVTNMNTHGEDFPTCLQTALRIHEQKTLSACALSKTGNITVEWSVGIIFDITEVSQLHLVRSTDGGSSGEYGLGEPPTTQSIVASLSNIDGRYNEWRVKGKKKIKGIFVRNVSDIRCWTTTEYFDPVAKRIIPTKDSLSFSLEEIRSYFPDQTLFTFNESKELVPV